MKLLSDRIKKALHDARMTPAELSDLTGISESAISQWLSGMTKSLKSDNAFLVAEATGVSAQWLASGKGTANDRHITVSDSASAVDQVSVRDPEENKLVAYFRKADNYGRKLILDIAKHEAGRRLSELHPSPDDTPPDSPSNRASRRKSDSS